MHEIVCDNSVSVNLTITSPVRLKNLLENEMEGNALGAKVSNALPDAVAVAVAAVTAVTAVGWGWAWSSSAPPAKMR